MGGLIFNLTLVLRRTQLQRHGTRQELTAWLYPLLARSFQAGCCHSPLRSICAGCTWMYINDQSVHTFYCGSISTGNLSWETRDQKDMKAKKWFLRSGLRAVSETLWKSCLCCFSGWREEQSLNSKKKQQQTNVNAKILFMVQLLSPLGKVLTEKVLDALQQTGTYRETAKETF